jgi:hypothetical protein
MNYLHLIDNLTGENINLLQTPSYTFTSRRSDYASRFRLVFSYTGDDVEGDDFAVIINGNIIVPNADADATLQMVDMTGRVIFSRSVTEDITTDGVAAGVYVLRLINGTDVKSQKIFVDTAK